MTERKNNPAAIDDIVFLGRALERLSVLIDEQSKAVFDDMGIVIPVHSCSLMVILAHLGAASASDLAKELGRSHQLVMQKIPKLVSLGLIHHQKDDEDARRRVFHLTDKGVEQLAKFEQCRARLHIVYEGLFAEAGDVKTLVDQMADALSVRPLGARINPDG
ncbi:MarR family transcriptional regulator [Asticcacaulis sp. SL142]|uniref:MarR family winged helix-turn-helix transcriptional regulator n=1 Tax=Asticcacaulis sp. SL142 TaxID=2995155 RepID=UPI00226CA8D5|nr:MarR family transcriptional regulator [Asticcacaulis sp. SL142]WAC48113.1 MarR family transcriptional regulator [Asticcacaulis sp. SL142]